MKLKKVVVAAATGLMSMALVAYDNKKNEESSAATGSESNVSSDSVAADATKIKAMGTGKLTMVTDAEFLPYEYHKGDDIKGIDVEACQVVVRKFGSKLEIEDVVFDAIIPGVTSGKADLAAAGITITEDRKQNMDSSDAYVNAKQLILIKGDLTLAGKDDLKDKEIGIQQGTTSDLISMEDFGDDAVVCFSKSMEVIQAFTQGKIDTVVADNQTAKQFIKGVPGIKALDASYSDESYAIGVKKGNTGLLNAVSGALSELESERKLGETMTWYTKAE